MKDKEIAVAAVKEEARTKPDEKVKIGRIYITYAELSERVEKGDKIIEKLFMKPYLKALKEDKEFRMRILSMLEIVE